MKTTIPILLIAISFSVFSCKQYRQQRVVKSETPKALQEEQAPSSFTSKRGYDNILNELYNELASKDQQLKQLETNISTVDDAKEDSLVLFSFFNDKNEKYYSIAKNLANSIHDSLLKKRIEALLTYSKNTYSANTGKHQAVLGSIKENDIAISDLHAVLKIVKTLPIIEKYEADNLKATLTPLKNYSQNQEKLIQKIDSASKK